MRVTAPLGVTVSAACAVGNVPFEKVVPKLLPFATERKRHKIARGGRGSGKSWSVARLLVAQGTVQWANGYKADYYRRYRGPVE